VGSKELGPPAANAGGFPFSGGWLVRLAARAGRPDFVGLQKFRP